MDMESLTNLFVQKCREIFRDNLVGVYLHGSAVMGCFNAEKSDIDLIVAVRKALTGEVKRRFMDAVTELNSLAPKKGIELSVVRSEVCKPFVYPTPYELHFSNTHLEWYKNNPDDYIARMQGVDKDLAAHFTIITRRGRTLFGENIWDVFGDVKKEYYFDSIWEDIKNAEQEISTCPTYMILNLCRVLAYSESGLVLSKREGGEWGLENLPEPYHGLIQSALRDYISPAEEEIDLTAAQEFAVYMLDLIRDSSQK